jgi:hypothetical protein
MAVGLYVRPPVEDMVTAIVDAEPNDAAQRFALARFRVEDVTEVLDQSRQARTDLQVAQRLAIDARIEADQREQAERTRLDDLEAARTQQQAFADQVTVRIEQALGELGALQTQDAALTEEIQRRQLELAALLNGGGSGVAVTVPEPPAEVSPATVDGLPAPGGTPVASPPSATGQTGDGTDETTTAPPTTAPPTTTTRPPRVVSITPVPTSWVGGIEVATAIAPQLQSLINAASTSGITLTGSGYRNILDQIQIRREVCGPTDYDIYDKPSWECSPPVARPGFSMHEKGLAIDFTWKNVSLTNQGNAAFDWLVANASRYGFYNLPSEPWHWSVSGK